MAETTTTTYVYDGLSSSDHIRLLELLPDRLQTAMISARIHQVLLPHDDVDFDQTVTPYTALSYTWGPDRDDKVPIWLDGERFMVRPNLLAALQTLRDNDRTMTLWVDAVCINQDNIYEKNYQVQRMGRIYRAARMVIIWLGPADDSAKLAIKYMRDRVDLAANVDPNNLPDTGPLAPPIEAIASLLRREYWSRAWIIQEVMLATAIQIYCGALFVTWDQLVSASHLARRQLLLPGEASSAQHLIDERTALVKRERPLLAQTLESLVKAYHGSKCSDRRDRIFAFLSLASDCAFGQGPAPDYSIARLTLLVQVLEYCKPRDPIGFISILFVALANEDKGRDAAWERAARHWIDASQTPPPPVDPPTLVAVTMPDDSSQPQAEVVQVTHFITKSSTMRNWVQHHTFSANLVDQHIVSSASQANTGARMATILGDRVQAAKSPRYRDRVCKVSDSQIGLLLHERHYVIFSTSPMTAESSPCDRLGLHADVQRCSFASCGMLEKFILT